MGFCNQRHIFLTICTLQILSTTERQVFDFLGFMWLPILVNFFNIIYSILGFFGACQYRYKYIIVYCGWTILWLSWNSFIICFYLSVGSLDKNSDLLNFGTGSFSWWLMNGPGCKPRFNNTQEDLVPYRPPRPSHVVGCYLDYEVVEIIHASTQLCLSVLGVILGIWLCRLFLEEDDSFDFVGGGDFGMAGHTPLHPMYVSYSALSPPAYSQKHSTDSYPTGTTSTHRSTLDNLIILPKKSSKQLEIVPERKNFALKSFISDIAQVNNRPPSTNESLSRKNNYGIEHMRNRTFTRDAQPIGQIDLSDYSNPIDLINRPASPGDDHYDSLENPSRSRFQKHRSHAPRYSPVPRQKSSGGRSTPSKSSNRNSCKSRVFADHIRDYPLRSYYSDPKLDEHSLNRRKKAQNKPNKRETRPNSMFINY